MALVFFSLSFSALVPWLGRALRWLFNTSSIKKQVSCALGRSGRANQRRIEASCARRERTIRFFDCFFPFRKECFIFSRFAAFEFFPCEKSSPSLFALALHPLKSPFSPPSNTSAGTLAASPNPLRLPNRRWTFPGAREKRRRRRKGKQNIGGHRAETRHRLLHAPFSARRLRLFRHVSPAARRDHGRGQPRLSHPSCLARKN